MRKPLISVRYATDNFNWLNRLNHRYEIGKLNTRVNNLSLYSNIHYNSGSWRDWKPVYQYPCYPPALEKLKIRFCNCNPMRDKIKPKRCKAIIYSIKKFDNQ